MIPSVYQQKIYDFVLGNKKNLIIQAYAGSGKSTTLLEVLKRLPVSEQKNSLFIAFNSDIVASLAKRAPKDVQCKTFHSIGLAAVTKAFGKVTVDNRREKIRKISESLLGSEKENAEDRENLEQTVSLCKAFLAHTEEEIRSVMDQYEIDTLRKDFPELVIKALDLCARQNKVVDFDDMIWFVSRFDLSLPKFTNVLVDEVQDINRNRMDILRKFKESGSRIIACGDQNQAIYAFCGALQNSMTELQEMIGAEELPLSISYRCSRSVVNEARRLVPGIEPAETAPEGAVVRKTRAEMIAEAGPGDFIISRLNAPLISLCLGFLKEGRRANIQGRDVGKSLSSMIRQSKKDTVEGFLSWLDEWLGREMERYQARKRDVTPLQDRAECLEALCEGARDLREVEARIKSLFQETDKGNPGMDKIICVTGHRSKGLERDNVWMLTETFAKIKGEQENNIQYVAITRAKKNLYLVEG